MSTNVTLKRICCDPPEAQCSVPTNNVAAEYNSFMGWLRLEMRGQIGLVSRGHSFGRVRGS